ncbi:hypothetical protein vseg_018363 [Gypsophila vaccaria]
MGEENAPKLLDLMLKKQTKTQKQTTSIVICEENCKLQLKLGLPCEDDWLVRENNGGGGGGGGGGGELKKVQVAGISNTSQKRAAPSPVVGWPPIRSFRKNLASSSSAKTGSDLQNAVPSEAAVNEKQATENTNKGLFVKINMDGVPIGRKVDLNAYNNYDNLSSAVDTLFRGLLAAQKDSSAGGIENKHDEQKPITGLLDGTGEYTLVYEDNEGDRMLVGDVPWHMFVSTVKRLRVLKTSDLPTLSRGSKECKVMIEGESK